MLHPTTASSSAALPRTTPRGPRTRRPGGRLVLAAGILAAAVVPVWAGPANADHDAPCAESEVPGSERLADTHEKVNPAFDRMHVERAQELATGKGVKVAVIDSGIVGGEGAVIPYGGLAVAGVNPNTRLSGHGTIVANLIAGPHGVARDAQVFDVKVFDVEGADTTQGEVPLTSAGMVAAIEDVIAANRRERFDVVNISLAVTANDPALEAAVARLVAQDLVVVASSGNREEGDAASEDDFKGTPGNNADVFPADYPGVVAVSATPPDGGDPSQYVKPNTDTDVAAPTLGAISVNATGQVCVVPQVATSWAAAEVSGILALLSERFPRETPRQLVARLEATTESGGVPPSEESEESEDGTVARDPWIGAGVVQAHDALTRQLKPGRQGKVETTLRETRADAQAPPAPQRVDLFSTPRAILLWSGLVAGALLALAFMLRPLVRR
ncbi:S8 family serine peptidase [Nocardioides baculatus]|uniref:S8 family serine peptidase n=1 Tax=Nocardioides baculatus TaxID=2801337 RepID=A0ABS1L5Z4_9ACTN|nr:S8 family serine peptidase [Nocardioides baculatus]MBL0746362.1 S8 family serine peptidase [Nocardioides baculatus]